VKSLIGLINNSIKNLAIVRSECCIVACIILITNSIRQIIPPTSNSFGTEGKTDNCPDTAVMFIWKNTPNLRLYHTIMIPDTSVKSGSWRGVKIKWEFPYFWLGKWDFMHALGLGFISNKTIGNGITIWAGQLRPWDFCSWTHKNPPSRPPYKLA
jgi:hypothetical protein